MRNHGLILTCLAFALSAGACKRFTKNSTAETKSGSFGSSADDPSEPATAMDRTGQKCDQGRLRWCYVYAYVHPASASFSGGSAAQEDTSQIIIEKLTSMRSQNVAQTCTRQQCVAIADWYLKNYYTTDYNLPAMFRHRVLAMQWQYDDGTFNDSDGLMCQADLLATAREYVESKAGAVCGKGNDIAH